MTALRVALPKGRLLAPSLELFARAGFDVPSQSEVDSRHLVFTRGGVEWILVKDCDVPVYVDHGAADVGVAGLDQILEHDGNAYQPLTLPFGHCRMMVVGAPDAGPIETATKVATKYPRIARRFLDGRGLRAEIVELRGSVELAAVLHLTSHVIDLVETGETARVHHLRLEEVIAEIQACLVTGRDAWRTDGARVRDLIDRVENAAFPKELIPS
jgi:ATP phosphoribosyltransferase